MRARRNLEARLRDVLRTFNYHEVQTPTFEELELFLAKSGPGIRDELYEFKDKGGRDIALRPELTAPVMRFYFSDLKMEPKPLRLFYFGSCFRYDRPQAGRYREFWQLGVELIGDDSPVAHAEMLALALRLLDESGVRKYVLRVGHLTLLRELLSQAGVASADQGPLMRLIDKKDLAGLRAALQGRTGADPDAILEFLQLDDIAALGPHAANPAAKEALGHLSRVLEQLTAFGIDPKRLRVDPAIARGLEYYTGLVFELDAPDLGAEKQLLGGGAYDLSGVFQQPSVASVGFALGFDRTLVALERAGAQPVRREPVQAHVAALSPDQLADSIRIAADLRRAGLRVELESGAVSPKKMLGRSAQLGARFAVFVGSKEAARGVVALKDLTSGQQSEVARDQVLDRLRGAFSAS